MTTMIEVSEVITSTEEIKITGKDLDQILLNGDMEEEFEDVSFSFHRDKKNEMSYIYKVASSKVKDAKNLQEMFTKMVGAIITINDSFKIKE